MSGLRFAHGGLRVALGCIGFSQHRHVAKYFMNRPGRFRLLPQRKIRESFLQGLIPGDVPNQIQKVLDQTADFDAWALPEGKTQDPSNAKSNQ
jgi:hypothetical protein